MGPHAFPDDRSFSQVKLQVAALSQESLKASDPIWDLLPIAQPLHTFPLQLLQSPHAIALVDMNVTSQPSPRLLSSRRRV